MRTVTDSPPPTYRLTEEQALLRDAVRTLADERVAPRAAETDKTGEFPEDLRQLLAAQDILALPFPEAYGGLGADLLTICLAVEQLSRACATTGLILAVQELASLPLLLAGTDEQKARFVPKLASGEHLIAFALTEAEAGSDVAAIRTTATRDGDDYVINGSKRFISHGSVADLITVFAVTDTDAAADTGRETPRRERLSCFLVEVPTPGFAVTRIEHKMGMRGSPTAELAFDGVRVPAANRIGEEGAGFGLAMKTFDRSRPGIAAQAVGIAQGALEVATAYARDRKQFGKRIGDLQMVGAMLADMDAATESARQLLYKACVEIEAGAPDASRWSAMCKLVAGDAAMRVTTDAVQVLGGYGYIDEFPVERMMRDAKLTQLYEGTQQIQRLVVARALLGKDS
jgi:alkylation response protein AidB-like acyl-CoA dehydrogenase